MLLAIDIGNSNITFGIFKAGKLKKQFDIPSKSYSKLRLQKLGTKPKISATVICSVVPKLAKILQHDLSILTGKKPYIIGKDLIVPIKNNYREPSQLGQDRLVNAYAAGKLYKAPLIVIDSGTAVTLDVVGKNKAYWGGLIIPGTEIALQALNEKTALLPLIKLTKPKQLIGGNTQESILSGVVHGMAGSVKELVSRIKEETGKNTRVIGTGGNISLIDKYSNIKIRLDTNLTLKGIELVYENAI